MRYFTSDLHFWHRNVIDFCNRPWKSVEEMNAGLIENWNSVVTSEDEVYIIGDMFFCGTIKAKEILSQLNGKKHLILGNHDWGKIKKHRAEEFGFQFIVNTFCIRIGKEDVLLSHFPYKNAGDHTDEERYAEHRLEDKGGWLLHGHVHNAWQVKGRMINVGCDVWDWKPVSELNILRIISESQVESNLGHR